MELKIDTSELVKELENIACEKCDKESWICMECEINRDIKHCIRDYIQKLNLSTI